MANSNKSREGGLCIQIDDDFRIGSDRMNIILENRTITKSGKNKGEELWSNESFHGSIDAALMKYLTIRTNCSDANTAAKLITEWNKTIRAFRKIMADYKRSKGEDVDEK